MNAWVIVFLILLTVIILVMVALNFRDLEYNTTNLAHSIYNYLLITLSLSAVVLVFQLILTILLYNCGDSSSIISCYGSSIWALITIIISFLLVIGMMILLGYSLTSIKDDQSPFYYRIIVSLVLTILLGVIYLVLIFLSLRQYYLLHNTALNNINT